MANHTVVRQIGDVGLSDKRHHMMLAVGAERNVANKDYIVIAADFLEGLGQDGARVHVIAGEELAVSLCNASRCFKEALAIWVIASPGQKGFDRGFGFFTSGTRIGCGGS
jgi:hypothetical protein